MVDTLLRSRRKLVRALRGLGRIGPRATGGGALARDLLGEARAVSVETDLGPLWLDADEQLMRPYIEQHRTWEPDLASFLRSELRPGMFVLDVGANIGYVTILLARGVTGSGRVVAVEADPYNIALLRANLWRTATRNAVVLPVAAHRASGCLHLTTSHYGRSTSAARTASEADLTASIPVPAVRLDDVLAEILQGRSLDLVKIDTEGADHLVVEGLRETLAANPHCVVVVELFPGQQSLAEGVTPAGTLAGYEALGYELELLGERGQARAVSADEVLEIGRRDPAIVLNLVLRRR